MDALSCENINSVPYLERGQIVARDFPCKGTEKSEKVSKCGTYLDLHVVEEQLLRAYHKVCVTHG